MIRPLVGRRLPAVVLALVMLPIGACSKAPNPPTPRYTHAQATKIVEQYIKAATATLRPQPRLEHSSDSEAPCAGPNDTDDTGLVMLKRVYRLRDIDKQINPAIFDQMFTYWNKHGFKRGYEHKTDIRIATASGPDGFTMQLIQGDEGTLSVSTQSPCVQPPPVGHQPTRIGG